MELSADAGWSRCIALLEKAFAQGQHQPLLQLLLTIDERNALATRVQIIESLLRRKPNQREMAHQLGVGIATITRGSNGLKETSPELISWLEAELLSM